MSSFIKIKKKKKKKKEKKKKKKNNNNNNTTTTTTKKHLSGQGSRWSGRKERSLDMRVPTCVQEKKKKATPTGRGCSAVCLRLEIAEVKKTVKK